MSGIIGKGGIRDEIPRCYVNFYSVVMHDENICEVEIVLFLLFQWGFCPFLPQCTKCVTYLVSEEYVAWYGIA
jgi:hypothetical protein